MTEKELLAKHPWLPYAGVQQGWFGLLDELATQIEQRLADEGLPPPSQSVRVEQIKEKLGGLRFYCSTISSVDDLIDAAEKRSEFICSHCGAPGCQRVRKTGWIITACEQHAEAGSIAAADVKQEMAKDTSLGFFETFKRMQKERNF